MRRAVLVLVVSLLALTGCSSMSGTGDKGYISGDGTVAITKAVDRGDPIELTGEDLEGDPVDLAGLRGEVVVINVWGSWCTPCRAEMPDLVEAAEASADRASYLGINIRDASTDKAKALVRNFEVPFPSIYSPDSKALLAFYGTLTPRSIPSTVVLDRQGRVAATILGAIPSVLTLTELVEDVAAEDG